MTVLHTPIYDTYAPIYDAIGQGRFGATLADLALRWLGERGIPVARVLDLACGTGEATLAFAAAGCQVVGVDQSAAMLAIARGKARAAGGDIAFIQADIRHLPTTDDRRPTTDDREPRTENRELATRTRSPVHPLTRSPAHDGSQWSVVDGRWSFDLATCFSDSLNYLTGDGDLALVCHGVAAALRPGGYLFFDLNTMDEYATWDECDVVTHDGRDCMVYNRLNYDPDTGLATGRIVWFVRETELWWRGEETHIERAWSETEVSAALADAGLVLVARLTPEGETAEVGAPRVVYVAQKGKRGSLRAPPL